LIDKLSIYYSLMRHEFEMITINQREALL